jgi:hypothetical protein
MMADAVQSLVGGTVLAVSVGVPLLVMFKLYPQPSAVYELPRRATGALIALAVASPVAGYHVTGALARALAAAGWRLSPEPGFSLAVPLLMASAFLFAAELAIVITLVMRRTRAGGKMAAG